MDARSRAAAAVALALLTAGCVGTGQAPADTRAGSPASSGPAGNVSAQGAPPPAASWSSLKDCSQATSLLHSDDAFVTGLANLTFAYTIPDGGTCSKVQAVLSGLQTGSVMVTGRGARDGCPQFTVSPGGVLTCSIEPLPTGPLTVWLNSTGAGNVTIHFWAVPAS